MVQFSQDETPTPAAQELYKQCQDLTWLDASCCVNPTNLGVAIRRPDNEYAFEPAAMEKRMKIAIGNLGMPVAFSMSSDITSAVFDQISPYQTEIVIQPRGTRIPVVGSLGDVRDRIPEVKQVYTCLVREEKLVLLWANNVEGLVSHGSHVEQMLMETIWGASFGSPRPMSIPASATSFSHFSGSNSQGVPSSLQTPRGTRSPSIQFSRPETPALAYFPRRGKNKEDAICTEVIEVDPSVEDIEDPEAINQGHAKRPMILTHSLMVGLALVILITVEGIVISKVISEIKYDGNYIRLAYLAVLPIFAGFALCSALLVVFAAFQIFLPVGDNLGNSRFYSAVAPKPARFGKVDLPHITIQIPVFTERLSHVIVPTIKSVRAAIRYYEKVGGTASIFINDDGMQLIDSDVASARRKYYAQNYIGWCSRPPNGQDGFFRGGRFKKASNMNYCLDFSNRVEDELLRLIGTREEGTENITLEQENELYQQALDTIIALDEGRTLAAGNVRLGEIILLIDCDTRVPETCLHMGALEMIECPDIAIVQHTSGVLKVAHNIFETGISFLTDLVYTAIAFTVGHGDCPSFVGHNAFLRWKALQSVVFEEDGVQKVWSETHVSEDFHLSIRLAIAGFAMRLASYHGEEFKEGVSLTVFDEIARWEKYAYGINELVFNPFYKWYKGPITGLYLRYFFSRVKPSSKLMVLSYTFTYYAIAAGLPLSLMNYLIVGWWPDLLDQFYVNSWKVIVVILIIFDVISPVAYVALRYRLNLQKIQSAILQTIMWTPLIVLYFGGLSFHLSKALLCHFVGIKMEWTATAKELETTGFFIGMDRVGKDFRYMYITMVLIIGGMIYLGAFAPVGWTINLWTVIFPLSFQVVCHCLVPVVLGIF